MASLRTASKKHCSRAKKHRKEIDLAVDGLIEEGPQEATSEDCDNANDYLASINAEIANVDSLMLASQEYREDLVDLKTATEQWIAQNCPS